MVHGIKHVKSRDYRCLAVDDLAGSALSIT